MSLIYLWVDTNVICKGLSIIFKSTVITSTIIAIKMRNLKKKRIKWQKNLPINFCSFDLSCEYKLMKQTQNRAKFSLKYYSINLIINSKIHQKQAQ